ncbi:biotin--[acetyl-CoA-carboxylase] ligase [Marinilabilia rubra]|uniref:Biotin--[acetyl-CoA-carboxylase] ligase n=1 Tax=Marinilabilia rubra TaxID=2162893 RepID=A0A2U2BDQ4_9BACT|nr:biotin--[acetyl-CoA-carboxylase] ligase [Marinilabilia rubra]PWE01163.1 biotin--[acetyl-CoA-carboxylase] ligase [Marinilabilia rubra]
MEITPEIIQPDKTESTSTFLKELLKQRFLPECSVVITNNQTAGRGQPGNKWESAPNKNLTFSMVFYPDQIHASHQFIISQTVSVAIAKAIEKYISPISIKWPNDIYLGNKKMGGILIENSLSGSTIDQSIIGIGLNINQEQFSEYLPNPTSVKLNSGKELPLSRVFREILEAIIEHYDLMLSENSMNITRDYFSHLYRKNEMGRYRDTKGEFKAEIKDIDKAGYLFLKRENGEISRYAFKEVEFIL